LVAWQLASSLGFVSTRVLAAPVTVIETGWDLLKTGELQVHLWVSLGRVARGLGIGVSAGLLLALVAGLFRLGEDLWPGGSVSRVVDGRRDSDEP